MLSRPGRETPDSFVRQQLLPRRETLGKGQGVVRAVYGAVAWAADVDCSVQDGVRVTLLPIAFVRTPAGVSRKAARVCSLRRTKALILVCSKQDCRY